MKFYDVQKLFSIAFEDKKSRRNLEYAVDFLAISKDIPFHRALSDAYYTGRVLAKIKDPQVLQMISFDGFIVPHNKKKRFILSLMIMPSISPGILRISRSFLLTRRFLPPNAICATAT